jgi:RNA-directed DNA polymerase
MKRTIYDDGLWHDARRGISLGSPLSPLMGAMYLKPLDDAMAESGLFYARFMDDWVVLAPTRWKLRKAVALVNRTLTGLNVWQHPDKTYIGRVDRGFDFLGYRFGPNGLTTVAKSCIENRNEHISRLYEHGADLIRIGRYVQRWFAWANGGLHPHRLMTTGLDVAFPWGGLGWPPRSCVPASAERHQE